MPAPRDPEKKRPADPSTQTRSLSLLPTRPSSAQTDVFALGQNGSWNVSWVVGAGTWNGPVAFS
jgi:hypothetical protein